MKKLFVDLSDKPDDFKIILLPIEHRFLIYNRVNESIDSLLRNWVLSLVNFKPIATLLLLGGSPCGYGDYFFCIELNA